MRDPKGPVVGARMFAVAALLALANTAAASVSETRLSSIILNARQSGSPSSSSSAHKALDGLLAPFTEKEVVEQCAVTERTQDPWW